MVAMLMACGSGDLTLNEADPDIVARKPTFKQVYPIFQRECNACHSGTDDGSRDDEEDEERKPANRTLGVEPGLESCQSIVSNLEDIVDAIFRDNSMPPGAWPRLTSTEKLTIERWIEGEPEAPCN